ncbi:Cytoplasmic tRNA 2-thiolation protein 2 [Podila horticola]|nr:Cytoplasmic tRNA 2-thiolation protein 2 [Podila horticola]
MSCSVEEPTMTTAEKRAKSRAVHVGFCCKCKTSKSTIVIRYAEYCDPCFLVALDSKFRTALRNCRPLRVITPENVMLAFSGGPSSRSLIHLFDVFHSLPPEVAGNKLQPKIYNDIHVCHIDESCLMEQEEAAQQDLSSSSTPTSLTEHPLSSMAEAKKIAAVYGYEFHGMQIEDIYDPEWTDSECFEAVALLLTSLPKDQLAISGQAPELLSQILPLPTLTTAKLSRQDKIKKLKALMSACTTLTAKETILQHFRSSLLTQQARKSGCTMLALGDSATRVAIQIIGLTAIGRGYSLPHETSLESKWVKDVKVIRPLKDCLTKELEICCRLNSLEQIEHHAANMEYSMRTKAEVKSINRLTEEFITGLDKDFPSTVATVCRTAAKLTAPEAALYSNRCPLCQGPVQSGVHEWKNRITVTTAPPSADGAGSPPESVATPNDDKSCCSSNNGSSGCCSTTESFPSAQAARLADTVPFSSLLCYGCLTNLRDLDLKSIGSSTGEDSSTFDLPPYVAETVLERVGFKSLEQYTEHMSIKPHSATMRTQESLRQQIQEFLIDSDGENE